MPEGTARPSVSLGRSVPIDRECGRLPALAGLGQAGDQLLLPGIHPDDGPVCRCKGGALHLHVLKRRVPIRGQRRNELLDVGFGTEPVFGPHAANRFGAHPMPLFFQSGLNLRQAADDPTLPLHRIVGHLIRDQRHAATGLVGTVRLVSEAGEACRKPSNDFGCMADRSLVGRFAHTESGGSRGRADRARPRSPNMSGRISAGRSREGREFRRCARSQRRPGSNRPGSAQD